MPPRRERWWPVPPHPGARRAREGGLDTSSCPRGSPPSSAALKASATMATSNRRASVKVGLAYCNPKKTLQASAARLRSLIHAGTMSANWWSGPRKRNSQSRGPVLSGTAVCIRPPKDSTRVSYSSADPSLPGVTWLSRWMSVSEICPEARPEANGKRSMSSRTTEW